MSYSSGNISYSDPQETASATSSSATATVTPTEESAELKLYQAFIFSVPIFFTFVLLFLFYLFYLRRRRVDWNSLRMRNSSSPFHASESDDTSSRAEMGLKKEVREMLPIIVFKESFSVSDTQCSVCLGDYQAEERLQQIPACGHTFHMDCIDSWLSAHATCPLCRQSLLVSAKASSTEVLVVQIQNNNRTSDADAGETSPQNGSIHLDNSSQQHNDSCNTDERILTRHNEEDARNTNVSREVIRNEL